MIVYILSTDPESIRTTMVQSLFDHPMFRTNIVNITPPAVIPTPTYDAKLELTPFNEAFRVNWCLSNGQQRYPRSNLIVVKDTSVSNTDAGTIAEIVSAAITSGNWDLCYLCRWLDRCDLYTDKKPITGRTTLIAKTQSPQGVQAIMFSPIGRDRVLGTARLSNGDTFTPIRKPLGVQLNEVITSGALTATCIVPNLIEYDITASTRSSDYLKLNECEVNGSTPTPPTPDNGPKFKFNMKWFWIILIIVALLLLVLWYRSRSSAVVIEPGITPPRYRL